MEGMADRKAFAYWLTTFFNTRNRTITKSYSYAGIWKNRRTC